MQVCLGEEAWFAGKSSKARRRKKMFLVVAMLKGSGIDKGYLRVSLGLSKFCSAFLLVLFFCIAMGF